VRFATEVANGQGFYTLAAIVQGRLHRLRRCGYPSPDIFIGYPALI
jgi:hypothetical protein